MKGVIIMENNDEKLKEIAELINLIIINNQERNEQQTKSIFKGTGYEP